MCLKCNFRLSINIKFGDILDVNHLNVFVINFLSKEIINFKKTTRNSANLIMDET